MSYPLAMNPPEDATQDVSIRPATLEDVEFIKDVAVKAGLFDAEGVSVFDEMLAPYFSMESSQHHWLVCEQQDRKLGASYFAPEPFADRMWNLYFLAVSPGAQAKGIGTALVSYIEHFLGCLSDRARTVIVETSSTDEFAGTRQFYEKMGFVEEARIRDYYGPKDNKVVFWKSLQVR